MPLKRFLYVLAMMLLVVLVGNTQAAGPDKWLDPRMGQLDVEIDYAFEGMPRASAIGQGRSVAVMFHELSGFVPIIQNKTFEWAMTGGMDVMHLDGDLILPDSAREAPDALVQSEDRDDGPPQTGERLDHRGIV